ncbi:hypothetical protein ACFQ4C_24720 [Larkinella insperata]|uniref:PepSY domain-containing protein n=1 Tax=Larkinella insperata TaxID=332158 RepID=A0ABW3QC68_9BACT|nr:hypothetical protein [Larkinella insperata]
MKKVMCVALLLAGLTVFESNAQNGPGGGRGRMQGMTQVEESALPAPVMTYVKDKYPGMTVRRIMKDKEDNYNLVVVADTTRKIVVFDSKGTFKEERAMRGRRGGPGGNNSNK